MAPSAIQPSLWTPIAPSAMEPSLWTPKAPPLAAAKTNPKTSATTQPTPDPTPLSAAAWDTHVHIFSPTTHAYSPTRSYTPPSAPLTSLLTFSSSLALTPTRSPLPSNLILVQPSPYGTDNSLILDVLEAQAQDQSSPAPLASLPRFRAIIVLDPMAVTLDELRLMDALGVRGVRINVESSGSGVAVESLRRRIVEMAEVTVAAGLGAKWLIQLFIAGRLWDDLYETISTLPVRIIADHQGGMKGFSSLPTSSPPLSQPGLASLVSLAKSGRVYVKISGLYRSSTLKQVEHTDMEELLTYFANQIPDKLVWGSDWPHTGSGEERKLRELERKRGNGETGQGVEGFRSVDVGAMVRNVRSWVGEEVWQRMLVETPAELFV